LPFFFFFSLLTSSPSTRHVVNMTAHSCVNCREEKKNKKGARTVHVFFTLSLWNSCVMFVFLLCYSYVRLVFFVCILCCSFRYSLSFFCLVPLSSPSTVHLCSPTMASPETQRRLKTLKSRPGNSRCVECGAHNPSWASVRYEVHSALLLSLSVCSTNVYIL